MPIEQESEDGRIGRTRERKCDKIYFGPTIRNQGLRKEFLDKVSKWNGIWVLVLCVEYGWVARGIGESFASALASLNDVLRHRFSHWRCCLGAPQPFSAGLLVETLPQLT